MKCVVGAVVMSVLLGSPLAGAKSRGARPAPAPAPAIVERSAKADKPAPRASSSDEDGATTTSAKTADGRTIKTKTYTFGAMDVEGKLKTPQLLYFLNRVKLELDMSAPDKRSFMKELVKSADDKSL
ncbi:MAG TPA: hypothetical protein VHL80_01145 [Polyangia bacterium]|nr:hypothetical protein [Polyangia bacterium]